MPNDLPVVDPVESEAFADVMRGFKNLLLGSNVAVDISTFVTGYSLNMITQAMSQTIFARLGDMAADAFYRMSATLPGMLVSLVPSTYDFWKTLDRGVDLFQGIKNFLNVAMSSRYSAYWDMYRMGYIMQYEFLGLVGCQNMGQFYQKAGLPDSVKNIINSYQNGSLSEAGLVSGMQVGNMSTVYSVMGSKWKSVDEAARTLSSSLDINCTFSDVYDVLTAYSPIMLGGSQEDRDDFVASLTTLSNLTNGSISVSDIMDLTTVYVHDESIGDDGTQSLNNLLVSSSMFAATASVAATAELVPSRLIQNKLAVDTLNLSQTKTDLVCDATTRGNAGLFSEFVAGFGVNTEGFYIKEPLRK